MFRAACLLLSGLALSVCAQAPSKLEAAGALLRAQDFAGAEALLRSLTEAEPDNARAWQLLAGAVHSQERWADAVALHARAAAFAENLPAARYNLACAYARNQQSDMAVKLLLELKQDGRMNLTAIALDPDLATLADDSRLHSLQPSARALADPFVESVRILRVWNGEGQNDQFGWIARDIGDVDADGAQDFATSAPTFGADGSQRGKIYVYSSRSGQLLWSAVGEPKEQLGLGIEAAGDVDGDEVGDVVAGAPGGDRVQVFGGRTGESILELGAQQAGEWFGHRVSDCGDVDGDGHADLLVGAPRNDQAGEDAGAIYLFSGRDGSLMWSFYGENDNAQLGSSAAGAMLDGQLYLLIGAPGSGSGGRGYAFRSLSTKPDYVIESAPSSARLGGMFASVVGDLDADGNADFYLSDWADAAKGAQTGRIVVHSGATGAQLLALGGEGAGEGFGIGPADAGDLDGDGRDDLVIGAWQYGGAAPSGGRVYLYSATGKLLSKITCKVAGETFGFDATGLGDVDGDGNIDLLLTAAWSAVRGAHSGRVLLLSGRLERGG